ncbi:aldehyde dehydrogenase family protein [Conexibacter stalactiti]|uniref:Aldehyde dehydrogenase family protein n=1 Tax=Conexibacter stalactiti TaxID=1940611 RepID=A0ABU4HUF0_9ACTN|nr:aldehyde dehydrogenase family protein [Conexibacter stalactiti]MDW5596878.1 aldehyde dehydrogenase family protein [Conexibacter stalactiti]MEC5037520.1 aldehyde dehydrogenase family protein [Conexibacter stalactiti]
MTDTLVQDPIATYVGGRDFKMLIGEQLVDAQDGASTDVLDPSTGEKLTTVPTGGAADMERAIAAARAAQPEWERIGVAGRSACFARFDALISEHREELAMLDAIDCGNPVKAMRVDVDLCHAYLRGWPAIAAAQTGDVIPASPGNLHYTAHRPYGVVGRITAFNHPLMFAVTRPLPSLIAGNTLVMKPSPDTSLSTLALAELFAEAFPPGVVNIVTGGGAAGDALVTHRDVKRIAFTGSVQTGLLIQRRAAESGMVKHLSLELGGKNAMIVFPDVDVDEAVEGAIYGMNLDVCQGQSCGSNSRVLVHRKIHDEFVAKMADRLSGYVVGVAYDEATDVGPLVTPAHHQRVAGFVESGVDEGAELVFGGDRPAGAPAGGNFITPALFAGVRPEMKIGHEEIFGPVISTFQWDDYDAMIEMANSTDLGLTASVWTRDLDVAHKTAERLDAGYVWVNDSTRHYFGTPFGGSKNSGIGREESPDELLSYLEQKVVHTRLGDPRAALARMVA